MQDDTLLAGSAAGVVATVLVAAPLMAIFYVVSLRSDTHDFSGRVVSMSVLAMVSEHHDGDDEFGWIPWLVVAQLWLMTGLLLATLERETRVYARKLWEQAHALGHAGSTYCLGLMYSERYL